MNWTDVLFWSGLGLFGILLGLLVYRIDQVYHLLTNDRSAETVLDTEETIMVIPKILAEMVSLRHRITQLEHTCADLQKGVTALENELETMFEGGR